MGTRRLQNELDEFNRDPPTYCSAGPKDDNIKIWEAKIIGPEGTPYEGGVFR